MQLTVPDAVQAKWQGIVDIMAQIAGVPAGLIMRIVGDEIEVFVASRTEGNPYHPGESKTLPGSGLYCETVIRSQNQLLVPDAVADPLWRSNPDVVRNMVSYLGYPISWPDRTPFGTICLLDDRHNAYTEFYKTLVLQFRGIIEGDLELIHVETRRAAAEDALAASERRWRFALEGAGQGVWDFDLHTSTAFFSRGWKAMLGHADDEIGDVQSEWSSRLHPDYRAHSLAAAREGASEIEYRSATRTATRSGSCLAARRRARRTASALRTIGTTPTSPPWEARGRLPPNRPACPGPSPEERLRITLNPSATP